MNQDVQDALCFVLWHHQGGSSTIGQPIRKMFGLGPHESMDKNELEGAKRVQQALSVSPQRTWVNATTWRGLTDEELNEAMHYWSDDSRSSYGGADAADSEYVDMRDTWRYIEAKLKEKNNGT